MSRLLAGMVQPDFSTTTRKVDEMTRISLYFWEALIGLLDVSQAQQLKANADQEGEGLHG